MVGNDHRRDREAKGKDLKNLPAKEKSAQYDLFTEFYGDETKLTNTIELWDAIPKFSCSRQKQLSMRDETGRLPTWEREFVYKPQAAGVSIPAKMRMTPARIIVDGFEKDFMPSKDEEIIEDILRKIFSDQRFGRHYNQLAESYVDFTLGMIYRELKVWGHTRSKEEIKRSLDIMAGCHMTLHFEGAGKKAVFKGAILPEVMEVGRADYLADPKARWRARLPQIYSKAINSLEVRQYNYATLMSMSSQLAKWLQKVLASRYTFAEVTKPFRIRYSTIKRESGMLLHSREGRNKDTVLEAIEDLKTEDVLNFFKVETATNDPKDPLYELYPTGTFIGEMKAANRRKSDHDKKTPPVSSFSTSIARQVTHSGRDETSNITRR